eukprot:351841-Chlamydomonas_euryale.AAC.12
MPATRIRRLLRACQVYKPPLCGRAARGPFPIENRRSDVHSLRAPIHYLALGCLQLVLPVAASRHPLASDAAYSWHPLVSDAASSWFALLQLAFTVTQLALRSLRSLAPPMLTYAPLAHIDRLLRRSEHKRSHSLVPPQAHMNRLQRRSCTTA